MASARSRLASSENNGSAASARCPHGVGLCLFDLDGTILDHERGLAPRVAAAIRALQEAGVVTAVCSGRPRALIEGPVTEAGCMDCYVTSNGACIAGSSFEVLERRPIAREDALALYQELKPLRASWRVHLGMATYAELGGVSYMAAREKRGHGRGGLLSLVRQAKRMPVLSMPGWHSRLSALPELRKAEEGVEKMDCSFPSPQAMHEARTLISSEGIWEAAEMGPAELEITRRGVTKGTGAEELAAHFGIAKDRVVAFGDGGNDMPLIGHVGHFVAMGNAVPELKELADEQCPAIDEDGVAQWIEALLA